MFRVPRHRAKKIYTASGFPLVVPRYMSSQNAPQRGWAWTVLEHRFEITLGFLLLLNIIVFFSRVLPQYPVYSHYDGWVVFTREFRQVLLDPTHVMFSEYNFTNVDEWYTYWHSFTPLYPFLAALFSFVVGNVVASMILVSLLFSLMGLVYARKIVMEFLHFDRQRATRFTCILVSLNVVSHYFIVPLPISVLFSLPIVGTYATVKFFMSGRGWKDGLLLAVPMTVIMFTREIIWPVLVLPVAVALVVKAGNLAGHVDLPRIQFIRTVVVLVITGILVPCGIYGVYLFGSGTWRALFIQVGSILECPKFLFGLVYSLLNTIVFGWLFIVARFVVFLRQLRKGALLQGGFLVIGTVLFMYCLSLASNDFQHVSEGIETVMAVLATLLLVSFVTIMAIVATRAFLPVTGGAPVHGVPPSPGRGGNACIENGSSARVLTEQVNLVWFLIMFAALVFVPGCFMTNYFIPISLVLAMQVFKGTDLAHDKQIKELLFWIVIWTSVVVAILQVFPFYPFPGLDMTYFLPTWLRQELGWPFPPA